MAKLTLENLASLSNQTSAITTINANSDAIETALENTLSRDGTSPNTMSATLDMNSNRIMNLPEPSSNHEPVRLIDLDSIEAGEGGIGGSAGVTDNRLIRSDGTGGATIQNSAVTLSDAADLSGINDLTVTDDIIAGGGLQVGFSGTPTDDRADVGDANFYLDFNGGTAPRINFDSGDYISYTRSSNIWNWFIGGSGFLTLNTTQLYPSVDDAISVPDNTWL